MFSMRDQILMKDKCTKINAKRKRMIVPDIMLHTKNVMIPVVKPVPVKQSFNAHLLKSRPQILKAQTYRNNPELLFSETPLQTLYNPLEKLLEVNYLSTLKAVKKVEQCKAKNQTTKYTISGKTDPKSVEKISILQNLYPTKELLRKGKDNALCFPNTTPKYVELLASDKALQKASLKSIQLSRKCNLLQIRGDQIKDEDKLAVVPRAEMPINDIASKPQIVPLPSESFYDIVDTGSTVSTVSSFRIDSKRTFTNIGNREKSLFRVASNHLHSSNSEYEINVLHYENDVPSGNRLSHLAPFSLNSAGTNSPPIENVGAVAIQNDYENYNNKRDVMGETHGKWDVNRAIRDIKYSWEDADNWILPSLKRKYKNPYEIQNFGRHDGKPYDCNVKYSWQVVGTSTQTSRSLLRDLLNDYDAADCNKSGYKVCGVKYSWQIIGISTQTSLRDSSDPDYWSGVLVTPNKNYNEKNSRVNNKEADRAKYPENRLKRYIILNNQQTQTFSEKNIQADINAKYSWHNLIKQYLYN